MISEQQNSSERTSSADSRGYVRLAIPLMTKYDIPITPENYAVWYIYVSGTNSELNRTIDAICTEGKPFTDEINEKLHHHFCTDGDETELKKLREDLRQILVTILGQVADLTGQTQKYELFIANSIDVLTDDASVDDVKKVIGDLIRETKTIGKFGKTIQNELKETTRALETLKQELEQVKMEALVDFLTGVPNRKAFNDMLDKSISEARSDGKTLSLLLIDIDHFKSFNDKYGHLIGDEVLRFAAKKIKEMVRGNDYLARFGGEEFIVILPQTPLAGAKVVAETIRHFFAQTKLKSVSTAKNLGAVTMSIGVSSYHGNETPEQFIARADQALYLAKNSGRNRVAAETGLAPTGDFKI
jgi:diguanylate cyclase